jgi:hypothetical protein
MKNHLSGNRPTGKNPARGLSQRFLAAALLSLLLVIFASRPAWAETRVALVIGIGAYQNAPPLANPVSDAQAIGDALRRLNFEVTELHDADFTTLSRGLRDFGIHAQSADVAVVYFTGHGLQADNQNYLLPADAKLARAYDLQYEALPLSLMLGEVSQAHKIGIVLLDASRNNPFTERIVRSTSAGGQTINTTAGLARVDDLPRNTLVALAAKPDQVADGGNSGNSPFAAALLTNLQIPGLELSLFFRSVRDTVLKATYNRQEPYVLSSLGAEPFYFYQRPPNRPPVIGPISKLGVLDTAGPTPLGIPRPIDPDQDPLTVRIVGLPLSGEVRVEGRRAASGEAFALERFMSATFKPDGERIGPIGTLDILVEDGRGGSATASLPIAVLRSNPPPVIEPQPPAVAPPETLATASAGPAPASPAPTAAPLSLASARGLALRVPCALIDVREGQPPDEPPDRLHVSGPTLPGAAFDSFLRVLGQAGRSVVVATDPLEPGQCAALAVITDLIQRSRERDPLQLTTPGSPIPVGGQLAVTVQALAGGALYVDLYAADGSVQHLRRGPVAGGSGVVAVPIAAPISGSSGQRLLIAITTPAPFDLAQRPANESGAAYLPALQRELAGLTPGAPEPRAELATLSVVGAARPSTLVPRQPPALPSPVRTPHVVSPRCAAIVERVQLGEALSDADRTLLQTDCAS